MQQGSFFLIWHNCTRWHIHHMKPADISMLISIHIYSKRKRYILRTVLIFFNIDFQRSKGGSTFFSKKIKTSYMFRPEYLQWQKVARVVLTLVISIRMITLLIQGLDKVWEYPIRNFDLISPTCNKLVFLIWHSGTTWHIYQMRSVDICMLIIIQIYRKGNVTYYELCSSFLLILTFSALMVGLCLLKKIETWYMFHPEYRMVLKAFITIIMKIMLL